MTVSGTVRTTGDSASAVQGAVVRATNPKAGTVDGEATTGTDGAYRIGGLPGDRYSIEVTPPSGYGWVPPVHVDRPESGDPEVTADFALPESMAGGVRTMPAGRLILKRANHFDLEGKTLRFTPNEAGGYSLAVSSLEWEEPGRGPAVITHEVQVDGYYYYGHQDDWVVELPFPFPFAGRTWMRVHANLNGHLSFQRPGSESWREHFPWADGTMRSVAAGIDTRATAGLEDMIAALWAIYGDTVVSIDSTPARVAITWRAVRPTPGYSFREPLGENLFQARLYPSGVVELAYRRVAERDGLVGLFHEQGARGDVLDAVEDAGGDVTESVLDITSVELVDTGSTVLARITVAADIPERVTDGLIGYRFFYDFGDYSCNAELLVTENGREPYGGCGADPRSVAYRVRGATVEMPISKILLHGTDRFSWDADTGWWRGEESEWDSIAEGGAVDVGAPERDLSAMEGPLAGNVFEVFHYPVFPKVQEHMTSYIYERAPTDDEIAVVFTDFRFDDLFGHGRAGGAINAAPQGIYERQPSPDRGHRFRSEALLTTMAPQFIGGANFWRETGVSEGHRFRNFAEGVWWIAHETTHRWVAYLRFRNPLSGEIESLRTDGAHWSNFLHAPEMHPVWSSFSDERYLPASVNGGSVWADNGDGTFTRQNSTGPAFLEFAEGLSALDLYAMGMIPPEEVPDTFLLRPAEGTEAWGTIEATKIPVRIEDIIAAMGPRVPAAAESRKEFRLGIYLLHDRRSPRPDMLERARGVARAVVEYFHVATGGRMRVILNPGYAY